MTRDHTTLREELAGFHARRREIDGFGQATDDRGTAAWAEDGTLGAIEERQRAGARRG